MDLKTDRQINRKGDRQTDGRKDRQINEYRENDGQTKWLADIRYYNY